jgi:hypothetical protein
MADFNLTGLEVFDDARRSHLIWLWFLVRIRCLILP